MIPVKDENPTLRTPYVTGLMILICVVVFVWVQPSATKSFDLLSEQETIEDIRFTYERAAIPCELSEGRPLTAAEIAATVQGGDTEACIDRLGGGGITPFADKNIWLSVLVSMFLHAGWLHLFGNMLFLWIFGNNVEDQMGRFSFLLLYLISGVVATAAHVLAQVDSTVPLVGASGAVAGVMGAYLVWFPWARVRTVIFLAFIPVWPRIPALVLLAFWLISPFFIGNDAGIAWGAHVAGFVFGMVTGIIARTDHGFERSLQAQYRRMARIR
ncbi:MAG: rhomboid family intramembrane serine protease [Actinomycetota bacterium]|nr:rhomboid family intramembrane serine protease [Actinomycetota bacterium]